MCTWLTRKIAYEIKFVLLSLARSTVTRVVGLDLVLLGLWKQRVDGTSRRISSSEKERYEESMGDLGRLLDIENDELQIKSNKTANVVPMVAIDLTLRAPTGKSNEDILD